MNLTAAIDELVTDLKAQEYLGEPLRVTTRLEDVQPPCVWVALESIDHYNAGGELLLRLFLIDGAIDEYRAIQNLGPLLDLVLQSVDPADVTTVVTIPLTSQRKAIPALRLTTSLTIS